MAKATVTIINRLGLHARAAAKFVQTASRFEATVQVSKSGKDVNGKSIMGVMMLAAAQGAEIQLEVEGADADQALQALVDLINDRFGEPS